MAHNVLFEDGTFRSWWIGTCCNCWTDVAMSIAVRGIPEHGIMR